MARFTLWAVLAFVLPLMVANQQSTSEDSSTPAFLKKRNLIDHDQKLTVEISFDPTFATSLATLKNVSYTYERNKKHRVSFNTTLGAIASHKKYYWRAYTDEYKAISRGRSTNVPQAGRQLIVREVDVVTQSLKDETKWQFQLRVDFGLVYSGNITDPSDEGLQIWNTPEEYFEPVIEKTQFWVLETMKSNINTSAVLANETLAAKEVEITLQFQIISVKGFMLTNSFEEAFRITPAMKVAGEQMKELLGENSIEYLAFTLFAHLLHGLFHILSLKNDIEYWNNVKDFEGVSLSNIWWEAFFHVLQVLYFWDTKFEGPALWLIYIIFKVHFFRHPTFPFFQIRVPESYGAKTKGIESKVIKVQLYVFSGIIAAYFGYRYFYNPPQEGLYTFVLKCMMYFSMAFSFVQMTPQVYINYVYKSVPPMPVRMLIYKFLDATVDDLITLALSLPPITLMMHFTDDLIFFILMVQRWMYKVDDRRTEKSHKDKPLDQVVHPVAQVKADEATEKTLAQEHAYATSEDSASEEAVERKPKANKKGSKGASRKDKSGESTQEPAATKKDN